MSDFGYKVRLVNENCYTSRFVAYHDDRFLGYNQAEEEAVKHLSSQTCPRCKKNHPNDTYVATDIERGEPDIYGAMVWRDAYPYYEEVEQVELFA